MWTLRPPIPSSSTPHLLRIQKGFPFAQSKMASTRLDVSRISGVRREARPMGWTTRNRCGRPSAASAIRVTKLDLTEKVELGKSGVEVSPLGIGAFSWGEKFFWGYGKDYGKEDIQGAYQAIVDSGISYIDTAEIYGFGKSEEFLGEFMNETSTSPVISTKFPPLPWKLSSESVVSSLEASLERLDLDCLGLYMIHWPGFLWNAFFNDAYVEGLATCVQSGLTKAVGVSNFSEKRIRNAHKILADKGIPLASNQVQYNLLYRAPERNGVLDTCKELGVTVCSYCPLAQGILTGKYSPDNLPAGARQSLFPAEMLEEVRPLLALMREIGDSHGGKTPAQVAINWAICKGTLPIVGAKNRKQVEEAAGAVGWALTEEEIEQLDEMSENMPQTQAAPYENW